jgi:hypothetical protein
MNPFELLAIAFGVLVAVLVYITFYLLGGEHNILIFIVICLTCIYFSSSLFDDNKHDID